MNRLKCSICDGSLAPIYELSNVPINLSCVDVASAGIKDTLSFSQCKQCNTIQLDKLIDLRILYAASHNYTSVGKAWEMYFQTMSDILTPVVNNKTVLEIGCPSGKLARKTADYNKWYIVEPNKNTSIDFSKNIVFVESFFDDTFKIDDSIDVIVHSHVFEHIYEPRRFLKKCREILKADGEMVFGVPNMEYLTEQALCLFAGVFFEHTVFLNKDNISYLLRQTGFELVEMVDYAQHSTIYRAKKSRFNNLESTIKIKDYRDTFFELIYKYADFVETCNNRMRTTTKDCYIFGASYNTQILLSFGLDNTRIKGILDNCKEKHDKYLYGTGLQIMSPVNSDCVVILKNGYYANEIREQLLALNSNIEIIC